ncbi:helicase associated domain-containing protein [Arthrobacter sp. ISL-72]|uniref:helicase associated domain-containing protein n=1 Tax=Arthrobacter sp. ISL-72 TaxID=2819114 RepID=UPI0037C1AB22
MRELVAVVQETGRYPSPGPGLRPSGAWESGWSDTDAAPPRGRWRPSTARDWACWQGAPRAVVDEARWQDRLAALVKYRAAGNDWPRHKATVAGEEHELGVWLHTQRYKLRRSELEPAEAQALNVSVPGWRTGRRPGRRPSPSRTASYG